MPPDPPRDRSGYEPEDVEQVKSACLTIVSIFGAYLDGLCIVGGLVPLLLIDLKQGRAPGEEGHPGTNDLDVALAIALLDDRRYEGIRDQLVASGFGPDTKTDTGNQRARRSRSPPPSPLMPRRSRNSYARLSKAWQMTSRARTTKVPSTSPISTFSPTRSTTKRPPMLTATSTSC